MRVFAAGLFVYVGLITFIVMLSESKWMEGVPSYVIGLTGAILAYALATFVYRLFNKRSESTRLPSIGEEKANEADATWHFTFTNTVQELLKAERAERRERSGMNIFFRGVVMFIGIVWIIVPFVTIGHAAHLWQPVISILLGLFVLHSFVVRPSLARYRIRRDYRALEEVDIEIGKFGIRMLANGLNVERPWAQLLGVMETSEGIVFYWQDDTKSWLPATAIGSEDTIHRLMQFLKHKIEEC